MSPFGFQGSSFVDFPILADVEMIADAGPVIPVLVLSVPVPLVDFLDGVFAVHIDMMDDDVLGGAGPAEREFFAEGQLGVVKHGGDYSPSSGSTISSNRSIIWEYSKLPLDDLSS